MHRRLRRLLIAILGLGLTTVGTASASDYRYSALPNPTGELTPLELWETGNGLPKGWRFHPVSPNGDYPTGKANYTVSLDPDSGTVMESYREGDVEVREPLVISREEYTALLTQRSVRQLWVDKARGTRSVSRGTARTGGPFRLELPVQLPKVLRSIVGDGAPNIEVSGSETITLAGVSDWTVGGIQTERRTQSAFPSLEMKQELNVNLTGSIGDKIKVDIDQSSNVATNLDNKVKLRYEGDDDDMVRAVDLGNTNLSVEGASFRQEGLFGIKTIFKLGNVDLVAIASKQEGKTETARFTPSGDKRREIIRDIDYIPRTYYFIADHPVKIDRSTLRVFKDDLIPSNDGTQGAVKGIGRLNPNAPADSALNPQREGNFYQLQPGIDYTIITPWLINDPSGIGLEIPVLKLTTRLNASDILAVSYTDVSTPGSPVVVGLSSTEDFAAENATLGKPANAYLLKVLRPDVNDIHVDANGEFIRTDPWYPAIPYELRNWYDLRGRDISLETLDLAVRRINFFEPNDRDAPEGGAPLIQILGLDQQSRPGAANANAPDGEVDDQFIDPEAGIIFFPDLHPFNPDTDSTGTYPCGPGFDGFLCLDNLTRNILRPGSSDIATEATPVPYHRRTVDPATDTRFYIDAQYKSAQQGFFLGRFDLLEESEQVKVDGILKQRGVDYSIDYQTGQLTFLNPPGPEQTVSVDYSFAPGVGSSQLTLMGGSASYVPSPNFSLTSSVLYDSRGAQETNPKLGEEPAKTVIGDLATIMTFRPVWMTQLANTIPGVRTTAPSFLNIQASGATSLPNPNTAGEAYIDDMEGNRESNTISLTRTSWFWSGVPLTDTAQPTPLPPATDVARHAQLQWYNVTSVHEVDLKPVLTKEEGSDNQHQTLEMNVLPPTGETLIVPESWTGLTQSLSTVGQDFSRLKYLELWVNDFRPDHTQTRAMLHLNFGRVSEDAFWNPDSIPNGELDTEDKNFDTRLDFDEDTGLDGLFNNQEPEYDPANGVTDPNGDDYHFNDDDPVATKYEHINGMEGNGQGLVGARPDTEDLNRDGYPDFANDYFEMTVDLSAAEFVAIDVPRDYAGDPDVKPNNGWRLFRIPIADSLWVRVGQASWQNIEHMRLWVNGMVDTTRLQIGGIELVGNRWLAAPIDTTEADRGVSLLVGVRNNKDDADIYTSPYEVQNNVGGTSTRREQSLALRYDGLEPGDSVLAFKAGVLDANTGLGWTQYGQVRFWAHGEAGVEAQKVRVFARFGADTVNFYEYSAPLHPGWQSVIIPMERLSGLKDTDVRVDSLTAAGTGEVYTVSGNPSFTRIIRLSFGVTVHGDAPGPHGGEVWIDDLRLSDVSRDQGLRGSVTMQANFADVLAVNATYQNEDADFFRVGTGLNRGSGVKRLQTGLSTTFQVDRLFPTSGMNLPVRYTMQHSADVPKFRTGSDVILSPSRSELETREQNRYSIDSSFRRTGPRKGLAGYTVDALSGNFIYTRSGTIGTQSIDSSWAFNSGLTYNLPIGGGGIGLGRKMKVNFLPDLVDLSMNWSSSRNLSYSRTILEDTDSTELRSDVKSRQLILDGRGNWTPLSSVTFTYRITSTRNMLLHQQGPFGWNQGTEIDQNRNIGLRYTPRWLAIFQPNLTLDGRYHQNSRPELRLTPSDPIGLKNIDNSGAARVTLTVPLTRFATRLAPKPGTKGAAELFHPVRLVFSRLADIQTSFNFERGGTASRVTGDAGFWYETGFTGVVSPTLNKSSNSTFTSRRAYTSGANTTIRPTSNTTVDVRGDQRLAYDDVYLGPRRTMTRTLPDVRGRWLDLQRFLGLQKTLSSLSLNSSFLKRVEETGAQDASPEQIRRTTTWGPLLGWDLAWKNGLRANVSSNVSAIELIDSRVSGATSDQQSASTDIRFTKIFPASRGIKFPWSKTPVRLPNDLNLNLTITLQSEHRVSTRPGFPDLVEADIDRLNVSSATNYNFTQAISGGFNLAFRQSKDNKTALTQRGITIAVNSQFRF